MSIDKNNLTNFQRIFRNEKEVKQQTANGNSLPTTDPISSVFNAIHSLELPDQSPSKGGSAIVCNPLLLGSLSHDEAKGNTSTTNNRNNSSVSDSLNEKVSNTSIHIDQIFTDPNDQVRTNSIDQGISISSHKIKVIFYL